MSVVKYINISGVSSYAPLCFVGSLIGAAASHVNTAMTTAANFAMQKDNQAWQTSEREASQKYQTSEREAGQAYQTSEREAQNKYAEQMYKNYSSPEAMARQYAQAGLNPRLAMDGSSAGSVTSGGGSNGGAPMASAPGAPSTGTPPYIPTDSLATGFVNMANALKSIAEAKKLGIDTKFLEESFNDRVKNEKYTAMSQEFYALVGQHVHTYKEQKEIEELGVKIAVGEATAEHIRETINNLKLDGKIKKNELDHWLETYQREANLVESTINRNSVLNAVDAQGIAESKSREVLNNSLAKLNFIDAETRSKINNAIYTKYQNEIKKLKGEQLNDFANYISSVISNFYHQNYGSKEISNGWVSQIGAGVTASLDSWFSGNSDQHKLDLKIKDFFDRVLSDDDNHKGK